MSELRREELFDMWPEDLTIPENAPGFYLAYSVNGQRFWRWGKARAMAIAIEALKLDPSVTVLAFGIRGWDCVYQRVIHNIGADFGNMDTTAMQAGVFGAAHAQSIGAHSHSIMTATEIRMKQQAAHQHSFIGQNKP